MIAVIVIALLSPIYNRFRYLAFLYAESITLGLEVIVNVINLAVCAMYVIWLACCLFCSITNIGKRTRESIVVLFMLVLSITYNYLYPRTDFYAFANYNANMRTRLKTIEMLKDGALTGFAIDMDEYRAVNVMSSYTGKIYDKSDDDIFEIVFPIYKDAFEERVLIYAANRNTNTGIGDFSQLNGNYVNIRQIEPFWYLAAYNGV
jgi:hypothetical protein